MNAEEQLEQMLKIAALPRRPSYTPGEVCALFNISKMQFWRMTERYSKNPMNGKPMEPWTMSTIRLQSQKRVLFTELVSFITRNESFNRVCELKDDFVKEIN